MEVTDAHMNDVTWTTRAWWEEDGVLCTEKTSPAKNGGRPIRARREVSIDGKHLTVTQEWAPGKVFTQQLALDC